MEVKYDKKSFIKAFFLDNSIVCFKCNDASFNPIRLDDINPEDLEIIDYINDSKKMAISVSFNYKNERMYCNIPIFDMVEYLFIKISLK